MIDAIDSDMNARTTARCEGISQHHARHPITHQTLPRAAELLGIHTDAGPSVHASTQELDPPRAFHGDQVVELRVQLAVQEVEGKEEDREGQVEVEEEKRLKEVRTWMTMEMK